MDFSSRGSKILFDEKEGYGAGGLAGGKKRLLNVKFERDIEVWLSGG